MESGTFPKVILIFPSVDFALTFLKINTDKSKLEVLGLVVIRGLLIYGVFF